MSTDLVSQHQPPITEVAKYGTAPGGQIYHLLPKVMKDIGEVRKGRRNEQFHFDFRGIDDVLNAVGPVLALHEVTVKVEATDITYKGWDQITRDERSNREKITKVTRCVLKLHVTFYAPDGSSVTNILPGEALDYGQDKSTNKAMASAFKYIMFFGLVIPVERRAIEDADADDDDDEKAAAGDGGGEEPKKKPEQKKLEGVAGDDGSHPKDAVAVYAVAKSHIANALTIPKLKACRERLKAAFAEGVFTQGDHDALLSDINHGIKNALEAMIDGTKDIDALNKSSDAVDEGVREGYLSPSDGKSLGKRVDGQARIISGRDKPAPVSEGVDPDPGDEPWTLGE